MQAEHEILVEIARLVVFAGTAPAAMQRAVLGWAAQHQAELALCWARAHSGLHPGKDPMMKLNTITDLKPSGSGVWRLYLRFDDDDRPESHDVVDLSSMLAQGGVFEPLRDPKIFLSVE